MLCSVLWTEIAQLVNNKVHDRWRILKHCLIVLLYIIKYWTEYFYNASDHMVFDLWLISNFTSLFIQTDKKLNWLVYYSQYLFSIFLFTPISRWIRFIGINFGFSPWQSVSPSCLFHFYYNPCYPLGY